MVQTLIGQVQCLDPVVYDWAHITSPTLVFGGADDFLAGTPANFQARMKHIADTVPNGRAKLHLISGLGHVPHLESPEKTYPPLIAFLKEGLTAGTVTAARLPFHSDSAPPPRSSSSTAATIPFNFSFHARLPASS
jgi:hypothetical protein